jgi:hypothetical protein
VLAQHREPERVEGVDRYFACSRTEAIAQTLAHFRGGPAGERDGETVLAGNAAFGHEMDDAMREGAGLSRARPGDDEQRTGDDGRRRALVAIEAGERAGASLRLAIDGGG